MADNLDIALVQKSGFHWSDVSRRAARPPRPGQLVSAAEAVSPPDPPLGPLENFTGVFSGNGFNTIFRPQDFPVTPTALPTPPPAGAITDNIFELNLTSETLSFSPALGSIPNRGMVQGDIFLNGVPYLQTINDITDPAQPVGIHFEPGVWLSVPTTTDPSEDVTLARMASIPHGTTIDAQGTSSTSAGAPTIPAVDITPSITGSNPIKKIKFPSQTATDSATFRIPQDLTPFIAAGTITQDILDDPNTVLRNQIGSQNITSTTTIEVSTSPGNPLFGGGTDNIAFLMGDATGAKPNANAVLMTATFWIESVELEITVPPTPAGQQVTITPDAPGVVPSFVVNPANDVAAECKVTMPYTQIQYSQLVLLNFNGLTWPHASVATLVPHDPIPVPQSALP